VAADDADPLSGTPYRALGLLGSGGMGVVLEAERRDIKKRVAVKVLHAKAGASAGEEDRLRVEAEALARIQSRYVVPILDFGRTSGGALYFAMELMRGRSLHEELKARKTLPELEAITIARHVLLGLEAAHKLGIVHRDLKPANVFLCDADGGDDGGPLGGRLARLMDFGVAKILAAAGPDGPSPPALPTQEGMVIGTPRYLTPEHVLGGIEPRSDVYAVGLLLHAMLTGQPLFDEGGLTSYARATVQDPPSAPSERSAGPVSAVLDGIVLACLAKDPSARPASARSLYDALGPLLVTKKLESKRPAPLGPAGSRRPANGTVPMGVYAVAGPSALARQYATELMDAPLARSAPEPVRAALAPREPARAALQAPRPRRARVGVGWLVAILLLVMLNAILIYTLRARGWNLL